MGYPRRCCRPCRWPPTLEMRAGRLWAGPVAPEDDATPVPAIVEIIPPETLRTRLFQLSAIYRFPELSTARPCGRYNWAEEAGPPSPEKPEVPVPATVVIMSPETFRTRCACGSEI